MKPVSTATRGLLFALTLLLSTLFAAPTASAKVTYRGFVEAGAGVGNLTLDNAQFSYVVATTHGIQYKNSFFGVGAALTPLYCSTEEDPILMPLSRGITKIQLPIYINWRYDFFGKNLSPWTPFVGVKAGLNFIESTAMVKDLYHYHSGVSDTKLWFGDCGLYVAIGGGCRKRLSSTSGLSLGLSLQLSGAAKYEPRAYYGYNSDVLHYSNSRYGLHSAINLSILATVAFDF